MTRMRKKGDLPVKLCAACRRPFAWRKKWEKVWDEVRYCSARCRRGAAPGIFGRAEKGDFGGVRVDKQG